MPKFRHRRDGHIIDVDENHAEQVIRKKPVFEEIDQPSEYEVKHKGFGKYCIVKDGEEISGKYDSKQEAQEALDAIA